MQLTINPNVLKLKESATLAINQQVKKLRQEGRDICHFGFGQSPFPVPDAIQSALKDHTDKKSYLPTRGLPELLDVIAEFYQAQCNYTFSADQVCIGPGSKELIFQAIFLLDGPLVIPAPSWVSYGPQATIRNKKVITVETQSENEYKLQANELEEAFNQVGKGQKILIFNNPNNPTGSVHRKAELEDLAMVCRRHNAIVISDEIYGLVDFSGRNHTSLVHYYPEGTIVTGGMSKAFSAGGYRLGLMIIPREMDQLMRALMSLVSETFSAVSAPIQYAALAAYQYSDEVREEVERCTEIHRFTGGYLHRRFVEMGLNCPRPEGAFYLFPDFENFREKLKRRSIRTSAQLCKSILDEVDVALLPASDFYLPESHLGTRVTSVDYDGAEALKGFTGPSLDQSELLRLFPRLVKGCDRLEDYLTRLS
ncbi:MAG: aminotransferase class I/II-fold pyridoxal phosphate-dependent enzyme [bacterium]|nr:aminotransferase class I/II-fold pyridoxal phosphate-dependent enzyme [Gammaproteobacteria bacterium]HIL96683.1 aminotransferase class I/II-fold pyridoxal phosphate-dependent enzyme [Pseudomonadales bacterium]